MNDVKKIYEILLKQFGPQGWWPLLGFDGANPTKTGSVRGYHPSFYQLPETDDQVFEVCVGAILTQNTSWTNVEKALVNLRGTGALSPKNILNVSDEKLKSAIRPAGYFNQKAKKLLVFAKFYLSLNNRSPARDELLNIWGVGNETADSILLYAFKIPIFVVDAYTRRIFSRFGLCSADASYEQVQELFHNALPKKHELFNEYHALIVELAKRNCTKNSPKCDSCPITKMCRKVL